MFYNDFQILLNFIVIKFSKIPRLFYNLFEKVLVPRLSQPHQVFHVAAFFRPNFV